ncbi:MAG TPA: hypothetical protein VGK03_07540 [Geothrix sp.]|jgi:hypothetical protein
MTVDGSRALRLTVGTAGAGLLLGGTALWLGLAESAIALWGFGAAGLLQVPPALSLRGRIREGLGNRGLERERLTLRTVSHLLRLLALGMALVSGAALMGDRAPQASLSALTVAVLAIVFLGPLWYAKQGLAGIHATLELDAARSRTLLELAALLLAGGLLGRWFPWADATTGMVMALRLFLEGRTLAKSTTLQAASCGSCGSCGCG